jgi:hypothetical protein
MKSPATRVELIRRQKRGAQMPEINQMLLGFLAAPFRGGARPGRQLA